ncbi:hypothetical protein RCO22_10725 [Pseudomonas yamanorum]|uniref:Uncharacterized protein n=1 Tax=Pseudomonas yamanorum TaxID=515393 RepID=A0ABU1CQ62_9PSED|nr:hypothetical protein [Pseudomonas yamanorum]MDR0189412.1 hypothetical protein [Pseudomonas yamanorum]
MGHSADYQTELYSQQLERLVRILSDQGENLLGVGLKELASSAFEQAERLKLVNIHLKNMMAR